MEGVFDLFEIKEVASQIIPLFSEKRIILFKGEMGMGKTTLIKEICSQMGIQENVSSPTYSIVNEYEGNDGVIYHFDFYRLNDEEEAYDFGVEEYFESGNICLCEWPEKISNLLPPEDECMIVEISLSGDKRIYKF